MWFSSQLLTWYNANKRALPWRKTKDPYRIWISEIILQQTRVNQGLPYYEAFIQKFPNVQALARADEQDVLKIWQGLGYYSRARNLHHASKQVAVNGGIFPSKYDDLIKLKGIGVYTAAAISSICFKEAKAVVDGNVYRVLSRFNGLADPIDSTAGQKLFAKLANQVMDKNDPGDYNQAIMEFGALQCKPANPDCASCSLNSKCVAFKTNKVNSYPVKTKKIKQRDRYFNYVLLDGDKGTFYQKRLKQDIWQNMYEPLLIESKKHLGKRGIINSKEWVAVFGDKRDINLVPSDSIEHKLTHQTIKAKFWKAHVDSSSVVEGSKLKEFASDELNEIPLPRLIEKYLELGH